ncbi:unnamed protein product [Caenorhabditis auriculariae]|uniref:Uncharacterized protein n=1 Tax=Caenorhabditis auriculariae TaxID=2777116 RepID=A0A8S1H5M9_9PELO|nr:unnamed protein product [Caenorhabditis auriculariae]
MEDEDRPRCCVNGDCNQCYSPTSPTPETQYQHHDWWYQQNEEGFCGSPSQEYQPNGLCCSQLDQNPERNEDVREDLEGERPRSPSPGLQQNRVASPQLDEVLATPPPPPPTSPPPPPPPPPEEDDEKKNQMKMMISRGVQRHQLAVDIEVLQFRDESEQERGGNKSNESENDSEDEENKESRSMKKGSKHTHKSRNVSESPDDDVDGENNSDDGHRRKNRSMKKSKKKRSSPSDSNDDGSTENGDRCAASLRGANSEDEIDEEPHSSRRSARGTTKAPAVSHRIDVATEGALIWRAITKAPAVAATLRIDIATEGAKIWRETTKAPAVSLRIDVATEGTKIWRATTKAPAVAVTPRIDVATEGAEIRREITKGLAVPCRVTVATEGAWFRETFLRILKKMVLRAEINALLLHSKELRARKTHESSSEDEVNVSPQVSPKSDSSPESPESPDELSGGEDNNESDDGGNRNDEEEIENLENGAEENREENDLDRSEVAPLAENGGNANEQQFNPLNLALNSLRVNPPPPMMPMPLMLGAPPMMPNWNPFLGPPHPPAPHPHPPFPPHPRIPFQNNSFNRRRPFNGNPTGNGQPPKRRFTGHFFPR